MDYKLILINNIEHPIQYYKIINKSSELIIKINNILIPFGLEKFNNKYYINIQIDFNTSDNNHKIGKIYDIEKHFNDYMKIKYDNKNYKFISSIKKKNSNNILLKLSIPIIKNNLICNYYIDNKKIKKNIFELNNYKDKKHSIEIKLNTLWIHNDTWGINWNANNLVLD